MGAPFPFDFPLPTAFYLTLYLATLVIHVAFMNYVLAGSAYLAAFAVRHGRDSNRLTDHPLAGPLRDWMPFMLSAAITAGIAPLLFIQILYQRQFYTANLLLFHRWMAILPVLIVGFYLLYLLKSRIIGEASFVWRIVVGCGAFACFAFVAWSWTENHLLSLNESAWSDQYASGRLFFRDPELGPRLAVWFTGAFPTMATIVAWQWWCLARLGRPVPATANQSCTRLALSGLATAIASAAWYVENLAPELRDQLVSSAYRPYLAAALVGVILQAAGWLAGRNQAGLQRGRLVLISAGWLLTVVGVSVLREGRRLAAIDVTALYDLHADAATVGGLAVFLVFAALNAGLIAWCLVTVRRGVRNQAP
ncbi:MAG: hypothetical protein EXS05_05375 [Planctomycetaceae bacterium]|nr:hypothetical protein [Planctomycetaceae bacterium]